MKNSHDNHSSDLLTISEVAWLLGVDRAVVCRAIRLGTLQVVRRRRRLLIPAHVLVHLADDGEQQDGRGDAR